MVDLVMNVMLLLMVGLMASGIAIHTGQWVVTGLTGALGSLFFAWRIAIGARNVVNYRLGLAGEQIVGTRLEELRASGCQVFHDLEVREKGRDPWNIDHIVVAPTGVYAIETKARRKSIQPTPDGQLGHKVIFDGRCLRYPRGTDTHGLEQAQRNADHLRELLRKQNTTDIPVFPVLVLPGWYVVVQKEGAVTVFNEKQVRHMGFKKPVALGPKLLAAVSAQIETLCQTEE